MQERNKLDFLSIGDITIDAFIRLKDAHVNCRIDKTACELCVRFGDKIPYEYVEIVKAVGNSANAAVAAARLGISSALVSNIGDDQNGKECLGILKENGVSVDYIKINRDVATNYHFVLWYEADRTILVRHEKYAYTLPTQLSTPRWMYVSSMGEESATFYSEIETYLKQNPDVRLAFQPGTFQIKLGVEKLREFYKRSEVFACNVEESQRILNAETRDLKILLKEIRSLGPRIAIITDGPKGAYADDGNEQWFMPIYPDPAPPKERTGAGDAFATTFVSALAIGKTIEEALLWAPINPMSVVQEVGAQHGLLTREKLEEYLKNAPSEYLPVKMQ